MIFDLFNELDDQDFSRTGIHDVHDGFPFLLFI